MSAARTSLILNGEPVTTDMAPGEVALDFLRRERGLKGTKEGCREGDCGACTVLLGERTASGMRYRAVASCLLPVGELHGRHLVTIEGLTGETLSAVQRAIVEEGATQCGFCTPGIVVALTGFLLTSPSLVEENALEAIDGNICRCTGYTSIRRAVARLVDALDFEPGAMENRHEELAEAGLLPPFFRGIAGRLAAMEDAASGGEPARGIPVAGGTDLFVQEPERLKNETLRFLSRDPRGEAVFEENGWIVMDATCTMEEIRNSPVLDTLFPSWKQMLGLHSSTLIRNRATPAGNIANASPIGDMSIILLALGARVEIGSGGSARTVALDRFFKGYKEIDLGPDEIITRILFPKPPEGSRFNFEKVSRREYLDIASVNTAFSCTVGNDVIRAARLSAGGVAPVPLFLAETSAWLAGRPLSAETALGAAERAAAEVTPISDVRGSAHYKRRLLRRLVAAHFVTCFPELSPEEIGHALA